MAAGPPTLPIRRPPRGKAVALSKVSPRRRPAPTKRGYGYGGGTRTADADQPPSRHLRPAVARGGCEARLHRSRRLRCRRLKIAVPHPPRRSRCGVSATGGRCVSGDRRAVHRRLSERDHGDAPTAPAAVATVLRSASRPPRRVGGGRRHIQHLPDALPQKVPNQKSWQLSFVQSTAVTRRRRSVRMSLVKSCRPALIDPIPTGRSPRCGQPARASTLAPPGFARHVPCFTEYHLPAKYWMAMSA